MVRGFQQGRGGTGTRAALACTLGLAAALMGCGTANDLGGSIEITHPLQFDELRARSLGQILVVEYLDHDGTSATPLKSCKLVIDLTGLTDQDSLSFEDEDFDRHVSVRRAHRAGLAFPIIARGQLDLNHLQFKTGGRVEGSFEAVFTVGRTIYGSFSARLEPISTLAEEEEAADEANELAREVTR